MRLETILTIDKLDQLFRVHSGLIIDNQTGHVYSKYTNKIHDTLPMDTITEIKPLFYDDKIKKNGDLIFDQYIFVRLWNPKEGLTLREMAYNAVYALPDNGHVDVAIIKEFGQVFCDNLNPIYATDNKSWQCGIFYQSPDNAYCVLQLGYGADNGLTFGIVDSIPSYVLSEVNPNTIDRVYKGEPNYDCVYLIKPCKPQAWLPFFARLDADETFYDLWQAGF